MAIRNRELWEMSCVAVLLWLSLFYCFMVCGILDYILFIVLPALWSREVSWATAAFKKLLMHPNCHTCPFPVSVYYPLMILLPRFPLRWNTICFWLSPVSFFHLSSQKHRGSPAFYPLVSDMSQDFLNRWGFKLIYGHNKRARHFNSIVCNFKLIP